jgi:hypothetical protein
MGAQYDIQACLLIFLDLSTIMELSRRPMANDDASLICLSIRHALMRPARSSTDAPNALKSFQI